MTLFSLDMGENKYGNCAPLSSRLEKSGSMLGAADDRLPALLPNLDIDTGNLSTSSINGGPCWLNNYVTQMTNHLFICSTTEWYFHITWELVVCSATG